MVSGETLQVGREWDLQKVSSINTLSMPSLKEPQVFKQPSSERIFCAKKDATSCSTASCPGQRSASSDSSPSAQPDGTRISP